MRMTVPADEPVPSPIPPTRCPLMRPARRLGRRARKAWPPVGSDRFRAVRF